MASKGIEEMEKRAEEISSRWKVIALLTAGLALATTLARRAMGLFRGRGET